MNVEKGFVDEPIEEGIDLREEILRLKRERNAVIMAHYYQREEIQQLADYIGDSLALAQLAAKTDAPVIVLCGVHFMGETAKILCPDKTVIVPDLSAGCSLADSCPADEFERFVKDHPGHTVVSYVNTSAAVKAVTDVVVTSSNAKEIVGSLPEDEKIIFGPDRNLGNYINSITGREMLLWDGACHVHEKFSVGKLLALKQEHPDARVLVHPECPKPVRILADKVGSTQALLNYAVDNESQEFIVCTESGILFEMQRRCPEKTFIPAPPEDGTCACNECEYMKLITLEKLYNSLKFMAPTIEVDKDIAERAVRPIQRRLDISRELGIINIGGEGTVTVDGTVYTLRTRDGLYVGRGSREISLASKDPACPAHFYFNSCPAHTAYPTVYIRPEDCVHQELGSQEDANSRTIRKYILPGQVKSCQLVMGMTTLNPGSVWNTMPCHTHDRRMEVYLYFDMPEDAFVVHMMGEGQQTRHIIMRNEQAVISPSWSIHSGVGTRAYTFIWGMCGENQDFDDMDGIAMKDLM